MCNSANKRRDAINCEPDYPAIKISKGIFKYAGKLGADIADTIGIITHAWKG